MKRTRLVCTLMLGAASAAGCADAAPTDLAPHTHLASGAEAGVVSPHLARINARLAAAGAGYAVERAEYVTVPTRSTGASNIVFANDRMLRLPSRWVPGDARRAADGNRITYLSWRPLMIANATNPAGPLDAGAAVDAAFDTWGRVRCGAPELVRRPDNTTAIPSAIFVGGNPFVADVVTLGFLPGDLFDIVLGAGARSVTLGVTFTFTFGSYDADGDFIPSDIDGDGRGDTALKEIWYNDDFVWTTSGAGGIDVETVALHEIGHALELGHFGRLTFDPRRSTVQASPRAVMNAVILGPQRTLLGTDNGALCGHFGGWPG